MKAEKLRENSYYSIDSTMGGTFKIRFDGAFNNFFTFTVMNKGWEGKGYSLSATQVEERVTPKLA